MLKFDVFICMWYTFIVEINYVLKYVKYGIIFAQYNNAATRNPHYYNVGEGNLANLFRHIYVSNSTKSYTIYIWQTYCDIWEKTLLTTAIYVSQESKVDDLPNAFVYET